MTAASQPDGGAASGAGRFQTERAAIYRRIFGPPAEVVPDPAAASSSIPRVDVSIHPPGFGAREFYTLVTSGMSDLPMRPPQDVERECRRAEICLYVDLPGPTFVKLLRSLARMPFEHGSWLSHGHTLPNGSPPKPLFPGSALDTLLVLDTIVAPERHLREQIQLDGDPLNVLWALPITGAECEWKLQHGLPSLLDRFNGAQLSFVLDPQRASAV